MSTNRIRATVSIGMACGLAVVLFFVLLGHHPLAEWDEGIYAEVAREMLPNGAWSGSWLTPHWNYQLWMEKPPLLMWLTALLYRMIGVSEFSARAISALAGVLTVGLLHAWLLKRFDALSAWLATLILLATFGFQHASRVGETDVLLSLCSFLALIGLARGRSSEPRGFLLFWIGFALAFMTKGMASLVLLLTATGMLAWDHFRGRRLSRNARLELSLGSLVFLAICVPWHAWMWFHFRAEFISTCLGWQVLDRVKHPIEGHFTHHWYYVWVLFVSAPFVSLGYVPALVGVWRDERLRVLRTFAAFAVAEIGVFSLAQTRLPHYLCPVYAPLSAITAVWAAQQLRRPWFRGRFTKRKQMAAWAVACVMYVIFLSATSGARKRLHSPRLADGNLAPNSRESASVLKPAYASGEVSGSVRPLLIWREGNFVPIASEIFYSRGPALQVSLQSRVPHSRSDRYVNDPVEIEMAAGQQPHTLLVEKPLLRQLPKSLDFQPMFVGPTLELGILRPSTNKR